jgi:hypothetical protein
MVRKQKLAAARVMFTDLGETITLADGTPIEEMLASWRISHMTSLGPQEGGYAALLLFEELPPESRGGRLGFDVAVE